MLSKLTLASFRPLVGSGFLLRRDDLELPLELVEATDRTPSGVSGEQFSLVFAGPAEPALPQSMYPLEHDRLGRLEIFLVPVGMDGGNRNYEAFFNRTAV